MAELMDTAAQAEAVIKDREREKSFTKLREANPRSPHKRRRTPTRSGYPVKGIPRVKNPKRSMEKERRQKRRPTMQELLLQEYDFDVDATESIYSTCSFQTKESSYRQAKDRTMRSAQTKQISVDTIESLVTQLKNVTS